jgi:hypothetical protein
MSQQNVETVRDLVAGDEPWEPGSYEMADVMDNDENVVTRLKRDMRGRSSGIEVQYDYWLVVTFRDGQAARLEWFEKRESALEAAGLAGLASHRNRHLSTTRDTA